MTIVNVSKVKDPAEAKFLCSKNVLMRWNEMFENVVPESRASIVDAAMEEFMNKVEAQELIINIVHARQVPEVEEKSPRALTDDEAKKWREAPASRSEAAFRKPPVENVHHQDMPQKGQPDNVQRTPITPKPVNPRPVKPPVEAPRPPIQRADIPRTQPVAPAVPPKPIAPATPVMQETPKTTPVVQGPPKAAPAVETPIEKPVEVKAAPTPTPAPAPTAAETPAPSAPAPVADSSSTTGSIPDDNEILAKLDAMLNTGIVSAEDAAKLTANADLRSNIVSNTKDDMMYFGDPLEEAIKQSLMDAQFSVH